MVLKILLLFIIFFVLKNVFKGVMAYNAIQEKMNEAAKKKAAASRKPGQSEVFDAEYTVVNEDR